LAAAVRELQAKRLATALPEFLVVEQQPNESAEALDARCKALEREAARKAGVTSWPTGGGPLFFIVRHG
jgi:hypothetical protein